MVTLTATGLSKRFVSAERTVRAVDEAGLSAVSGELLGVVGESGSGKTTLLRMLACQLSPDAGAVRIDGVEVPHPRSRAGARFRATQVGYVFQEFGLIEDESALRNVAIPLRYAGVSARRARTLASESLDELGVRPLAGSRVSTLSGGQRQRVAIARACVNSPLLFLADEPTSSLDQENADIVMDCIGRLRASGMVAIVATHDPAVAERCDRVVVMRGGRIADVR
ncbi:ABC transporter ATP-binding protein [Propionicicella superfundia]|uniref:ABC transporter ATP-binding protein n=1 Tax=Propionicicella superfundia TaxID=348582 RepID=UPI00041BCAA9|nr:ABC transporter ATP-binding protein [Propionicicella superfundia]